MELQDIEDTSFESSFQNFSIISFKRDSEMESSDSSTPIEYREHKNRRLVTEVDCIDRDRYKDSEEVK